MFHMDPATKILVKRGMRRGLLNIWREQEWVASLGALLGVFVLVQILAVGLISSDGIQTMLRARTDLRLEILPGTADQEIQNLLATAQQLPFVEEVVYITKEQAYDRARTDDPKLITFLEEFGLANPFADTIGVTLTSLDDYGDFLSFTEQEQWKDIIDPAFLSEATNQEEHVADLLRLTGAGQSISFIILLITAGVLTFIVMELTRSRAFARSEEVLVERLVGAHSLSIVVPFATEAIVLLAASIVGSAVIMIVLLFFLPWVIPALGSEGVLSVVRPHVIPLFITHIPLAIAIQVILAPGIAFLGAWLGVRQQIQSPRIAIAAH